MVWGGLLPEANGVTSKIMGFPPSLSQTSAEYLKNLIEILIRPIEVACQQGEGRKASIEKLERFISDQIVRALGEVILPRKVEAELFTLRSLFQHGVAESVTQELNRLQQAKTILHRLSFLVGTTVPEATFAETRFSSDKASPPFNTSTAYREARTLDHPHKPTKAPIHETSIRFAKGVGPKRAQLLEKLGIRTIEDALWVLPWRYEDRSGISSIHSLIPGGKATVSATINRTSLRRIPRRNMTIVSVHVHDQTGTMEAVFFNQPYLEKTFQSGMQVVLSGMVNTGPGKWARLQMRTPQYELVGPDDDMLLHVGRIVPVYHETKGLTSRYLRWIMKGLLEEYHDQLLDVLPLTIRQRFQWPTIEAALSSVHFPDQHACLHDLNGWQTPAHRRLAFEECFVLQLALAIRQHANHTESQGIAFKATTPLVDRLHGQLPFPLTGAQTRVIQDIQQDMTKPSPMNRLLQGDVGSGKTLVALHAVLLACGSGYQTALMVPTEILAEQHYVNLQQYLNPLGVRVVLVSGGLSAKKREEVFQRIAAGDIDLVVGTHALLEKTVQFAKLGLVVVDEQHKFGVLQRATLKTKGIHPDVLVMTATPIPRTLAMTAYGDLDVSIIDEMPPGRQPIQTKIFRQRSRARAYALIRKQVEAGRQAYIVYPLVEESEKIDLEAAMQAVERLQKEEFPLYTVGLLHGRMKSDEKAQVMTAFKDGLLQVLVATTVIEVGLDVPNATVMAIEHADRFGLAQLHQLRGRVGRGAHQSYCLLISSAGRGGQFQDSDSGEAFASTKNVTCSPELPLGFQATWTKQNTPSVTQTAQQRLRAMVECADGFAIAEQDLRIRGPGEFLGTRQWGIPEFRVADLVRDSHLHFITAFKSRL